MDPGVNQMRGDERSRASDAARGVDARDRFADRTETYAAGDAYYAPAGHTPVVTASTQIFEFSPTEALDATMTVVGANLAAAGVSS